MYVILKTVKGKSQRSRAKHPHQVSFPVSPVSGYKGKKLVPTHMLLPPYSQVQLQFFFLEIFTNSLRISYKGFDHIHPHSQIHTCSSYPNLPLTLCLFLKNKPIKHQNPNCIKVKDDSTGKSHSVTSKPDLLILRNF